jgi:hypothetical protein
MPTLSDIARDWNVSKQYVARKVKQGCPTDSLESAREWRANNAQSKAPRPKSSIAQIMEEREDDSPEARKHRKEFLKDRESSVLPKDIEPEEALQYSKRTLSEAHRLLDDAMVEGKPGKIAPLLAIHNKAMEAYWKSEQSYREELERRHVLIEVSVANERARRGWEIVVSRLAALPQNVAPRCNPHDPNHAMDILQHESAAIVADARKAFEE